MCNNLFGALEDELCREQLLHIVRRHVKLALEFGHSNTASERKEMIKKEVESLRVERDRLLHVKAVK